MKPQALSCISNKLLTTLIEGPGEKRRRRIAKEEGFDSRSVPGVAPFGETEDVVRAGKRESPVVFHPRIGHSASWTSLSSGR